MSPPVGKLGQVIVTFEPDATIPPFGLNVGPIRVATNVSAGGPESTMMTPVSGGEVPVSPPSATVTSPMGPPSVVPASPPSVMGGGGAGLLSPPHPINAPPPASAAASETDTTATKPLLRIPPS